MESLPTSQGNRAICVRFKQEGLDMADFSDSDVSEGELDDAIGDLQVVSSLASQSSQRRQGAVPFHIIFAVDTSASMGQNDVGGTQRLAAVLDACQGLIEQQSQEESAIERDCYTLVSFDVAAQAWFTRLGVQAALESLREVRSCLHPAVHSTLFGEAFKKIAGILVGDRKNMEDVRVVLLSDGAPHQGEHLGSLKCSKCALTRFEDGEACLECSRVQRGKCGGLVAEKSFTTEALLGQLEGELLDSAGARAAKQLIIYTVGFGTGTTDFAAFLKPLSDRTGGSFHFSNLSQLDLSRVFGTIVSSITTTRTSMTSMVPGIRMESCMERFDSASLGESCQRTCTIVQVRREHEEVRKKANNKSNTKSKTWAKESFTEQSKAREVKVAVESKPFAHGGMRLVYHMHDSWNMDRGQEKMVAKRLMRKEHGTKEHMLPFCRSTEAAISYRASFVDKLRRVGEHVQDKLWFVPCYLYNYVCEGNKFSFVAEQFLEGEFVKFNGNNGFVNESHPETEFLQAFSHFTFVRSRGKQLVLDLQGIVDNGCIVLTDPQVLSRVRSQDRHRLYGPGDLGFEGMKAFFETHQCGPTCEKLHLLEEQKKFQEDMEVKRRTCVVCLDGTRTTRFAPCGHSAACEDCALQLLEREEKCPICRVGIESYDKGNFSKTFVPPPRPPRGRASAAPRSAAPSAAASAGAPAADIQRLLLPSALPARPALAPRPPQPRRPLPQVNTRSTPSRGGSSNHKTQICSFWEWGECTRGSSCSFAHGLAELRR